MGKTKQKTSVEPVALGKGYQNGLGGKGDSGVRVRGHSNPTFTHTTSNTGSFVLTSITLNPGVAQDFPWLSNLALCFDMFTVNSFRIELDSAQPTSITGRVTLAGGYDYDDTLPASFASLSQTSDVKVGNAYQKMVWKLDPKKLSRPIFHVSPSPASVLSTDRDDIACVVFLASDSFQAALSLGLGVEYHYDFTFHSPCKPANQAVERPFSCWFKGVEYAGMDHLTIEFPKESVKRERRLLMTSSGLVDVPESDQVEVASSCEVLPDNPSGKDAPSDGDALA